jgi:hypothetical protein
MTTLPDDLDPLHQALIQFTGCIGEALSDICSYGLTIGEAYVPFDPDPEDDCPEDEEMVCSQAWVRVTSVNPLPNLTESWEGDTDAACSFRIGLEVGVLRCVEIPEEGNAPTASDVLVGALQAMTDMKAVQVAALGCEVWESIEVGEWHPSGPLGGQYGGVWSFTVEL